MSTDFVPNFFLTSKANLQVIKFGIDSENVFLAIVPRALGRRNADEVRTSYGARNSPLAWKRSTYGIVQILRVSIWRFDGHHFEWEYNAIF